DAVQPQHHRAVGLERRPELLLELARRRHWWTPLKKRQWTVRRQRPPDRAVAQWNSAAARPLQAYGRLHAQAVRDRRRQAVAPPLMTTGTDPELLFRQVVEGLGQPFYAVDRDWRVILYNDE